MSVQSELLIEITDFLAEREGDSDAISETTFGRLAVNDGKFVGRLRNGSNMTLATIDRVKQFLAAERARRPPKRRKRTPKLAAE